MTILGAWGPREESWLETAEKLPSAESLTKREVIDNVPPLIDELADAIDADFDPAA